MTPILFIMLFSLLFGLYLAYDFVMWKYAPQIAQYKNSRLADKMYKEQQKNLILYNIEKEKQKLAQRQWKDKNFPQTAKIGPKTYITNNVEAKIDFYEWEVENVEDLEYEPIIKAKLLDK